MKLGIFFTPAARRDLRGLPPQVQARILNALDAASDDPDRSFRRLKGTTASRLRVGDHRVIADIERNENRIIVLHIGHRRNVYE